jgi:hypothetical protein
MYGKRVFKSLAVLFMLFGLVGCGGSGGGNDGGNDSGKRSGKALTSVSELHYFPDSNITGADSVGHTIIRYYKSETDRDADKNVYKNKYNIYDPIGNATQFVVRRPLGTNNAINYVDLQTSNLSVDLYENPYRNYMTLDTIGDNIKRDDALFEEAFGYKGGILGKISVLKYFHRNATAELKAYGELLVRDHDFKEVESGIDGPYWQKVDDDYIYGFGYTAALYDPYAAGRIIQVASWSVTADLR